MLPYTGNAIQGTAQGGINFRVLPEEKATF
jgi:hypothetical protein